MKNRKRILMVSSEAVPYAKAGGLADMVSALSLELNGYGHDVRILLPCYGSIDKKGLEKLAGPIEIPMGNGNEKAEIYSHMLKDTLPVYFVDHDRLFDRAGIYGPNSGESYTDNGERFTLLCRSTFQLCRMIDWIPDIIHCHDWSAGLIPLYLNTIEYTKEFKNTASVFTIHNIGYQGIFSADETKHTCLFEPAALLHNNDMNFLKCGIDQSNIVTTVSRKYAQEIKTPEYGEGLEELLDYRKYDLFGILNGVDYNEWNPETDKYIKPLNYCVENLKNKKLLKEKLQKEAGLEINGDKPLIGIVSRLTGQKGLQELCLPSSGCLESLCGKMDLQIVVLGTGEKWCEEELNRLGKSLPNLKTWIEFDNRKAHLIEAGSDLFLMPSRYEPCGLNQLYSLRYGTLPIVRETGGLADTVEKYNEENGEGTGFTFNDLTPEAIFNVTGWAVWAWYNRKEHFEKMQQRAMKKDFSWKRAIPEYEKVYNEALKRRLDFS